MRCCNYHWPQILAFRDWTGAGEQGCSGAGIIPISPCPFGLSKFQEVRPASSSFKLPEYLSLRSMDCHRIGNQFEKGFFRLAFPNQVACISKPTRSLSVLHTRNAAGELERNIAWATKLHHEGLWHMNLLHEYRQAKLKGRIDCADRGRSTYGAPTSHEPQARATVEKSREGTTFLPQARLICSATGLLKIIQSYPVSDIFNPNRHLPHPPTSERCSEIFRKVR